MTLCAAAWSFQKSGAEACCSIVESSSEGRAASKITPQIGRALGKILIPAELIVELHRSHMSRRLFYSAIADCERRSGERD
jgi:hypothetical protein